ncbi:DJ-1/PfpI family protein [Pelosinus sp. sgz500959]|uniref:DJ-1/PfpI family protein n=1 Tax=Pelosinus sp. sgz500959 TaxID=3242472 RepID=UPI0036707CDE
MVTIGILIFPQVEELDFVGPFEVLSYVNKIQPSSTKVLLVAETAELIYGFNGMKIIPDMTLQDCPNLDVLVIPGGKGRIDAMKSTPIKEFIQKQMIAATYVTSVCTGAFLLAEAGLLTGKKATTYHTAFSELESYSVNVISSKVVQDGKIITSGGVSSGLELGFYLLKQLFSANLSQEVARKIEYAIDINSL